MRKLTCALAALALLAGCPSISTMGTARNVPEDDFQFHVATGGMILQDFETTDTGDTETLGYPSFEFGARYGVTDDVELGGKVWAIGAELNGKFQLRRSESTDHGIDLALSPAVSFYPFSEGALGWLHLSMPIGFNVPGGSQVVLAPRFSDLIVFGNGEVGNVVWAGGSLGYAWKIGRSGRFRILPEVAILVPLVTSVGTELETDFAFEGALIQAQIGFVFGG